MPQDREKKWNGLRGDQPFREGRATEFLPGCALLRNWPCGEMFPLGDTSGGVRDPEMAMFREVAVS